jgi:predicted nucleic acid-binding protein
LIDSDIFIDYLHLDQVSSTLIEGLIPAGVAISIITYFESYEGTFLEPDREAGQARHDRIVAGVPVVPFTTSTAKICARLRHDLASQGKRVRSRALDLMIAATAIEHDLILVTRNKSDYSDIPNFRMV